jgi:hypothetical protein
MITVAPTGGPETLPRNANGKIMKSELKTVFAKDPECA